MQAQIVTTAKAFTTAKATRNVVLDLDPVQSADLQGILAGAILDATQAEYEASLSTSTKNFGSAQNGLEILTEAKLGVLVAVQEGAYPSPSAVEEVCDLFVDGCVELSQVAEILPRRGQNVVVKQLVKGVKMIRRVGRFFC